MKYRKIVMVLFSAALLATPFAAAQGRGVWAAPSRNDRGSADHGGGGSRGNFFPPLSSQPWAVPAWVTGAGPRPVHHDRSFGRRGGIGLPYAYSPYYLPSYPSLGYYDGPTSPGPAMYTSASEGQIVVIQPENARGPQVSREALLERRLDEQALELDQIRREKSSAGGSSTRNGSVDDGEELQPATILVFKDKRHAEMIHNYAVVGSNLYVMGRNHRKIPLADLDIYATARANEEAGLEFKLPGTPSMKLRSGLGIDR